MKVVCPGCETSYNIPDDKIPSGGGTTTCKKCNSKIQVQPPQKESLDDMTEVKEDKLEEERIKVDERLPLMDKRAWEKVGRVSRKEERPEDEADKKDKSRRLLGNIWRRWEGAVFEPEGFFERMAEPGYLRQAFGFALIFLLICLVFQAVISAFMDIKEAPEFARDFLLLPGYFFISAGFTHLWVKIFRGSNRFEATLKVILYGESAVWLFAAIPFLGHIIFLVWVSVVKVKGIKSVHELGTGSSIACVLLPLPLFLTVFIAFWNFIHLYIQ